MDVEKHVASCVADGCVRMGGGVVNEPEEFVVGVVRGFGMLGGDGSNCDQHRRIDSDGIIQKGSDDLMDQVDQFWRDDSRRVGFVGVLYGCALYGLLLGMGASRWRCGVGCWNLCSDLAR